MFNRITAWMKKLAAAGANRGYRFRPALEGLEQRLQPAVATINWNDVQQTITGFGASSAWLASDLPQSQANLLFSPTQGIGLSLQRIRIAPDPAGSAGTPEVNLAKFAQPLGVTVWGTPWTPPAAWKSNGSIGNQDGGYLLPSHYQDYATALANFWLNMKAQGVNVYSISVQNEPDVTVGYEGCSWSSDQFAAFLPVLARTFAARGVTAKIMLPEEGHWDFSLADKIFSDPNLLKYVDILAAHGYGSQGPTYAPPPSGAYAPVPQSAGKQIWETETAELNSTFDAGIGNGLFWAHNIHDALTVAHVNAWHYWWAKSLNADNEGLLGVNGEATKRLYAVGNYSKFIRPGWVNIGETDDGGLSISSFRDPVSGQYAVVVVNSGPQVTEQFNLNGFTSPSVTPYVTSATADLAAQQAIPTSSSGSRFTATLAARSVTTFFGQAGAPTLPAAPTSLTAAGGDGQATLTWAASAGATSYNVYRGTAPGGEAATPYRTGITTTTFTDTGLTNGQSYYYQVSAFNSAGQGSKSQEVLARPQAAGGATNLLSNPGFETGGPSPWDTNWAALTTGDAHGGTYSVTVSGSSSGGIWQGVTGLKPNTTYTLTVYAKNSSGANAILFAKNFGGQEVDAGFNNSGYAPVSLTFRTGATNTGVEVGVWKFNGTVAVDDFLLAVVAPPSPAPAVTGISPTSGPQAGGTTVTISGTGFTGVTAVTFGSLAAASFRVVSDTQITATTPAGATAGAAHVSVTRANSTSSSSTADLFTYLAPPPQPPTGLTAASGDGQATLTWAASTGATSYNVYRGTAPGGEAATPYRTAVMGTTFTDTGLTNGTKYYYRLTAVNSAGEGARSAEVLASPTAFVGPRNLLTNPGFETGSLAGWGATQSSVTTANVHGGTFAVTVTGSSPSGSGIWQNVSGLSPNTTYSFRAYVRRPAGAVAYLFAKGFGNSEVDVLASGTDYSLVTLTFTTGSTNTTAQVGLWVGSGSGGVTADDFILMSGAGG